MYRNIVLPGGGVNGIAYVGVLRALEEKGILESVEAISGTSIGSLAALLWALGFTTEEMVDILESTDVSTFARNRCGFLQGIYNMTTKFGWYSAAGMRSFLSSVVSEKLGHADATFGDLGRRRLLVTASNVVRRDKVP